MLLQGKCVYNIFIKLDNKQVIYVFKCKKSCKKAILLSLAI